MPRPYPFHVYQEKAKPKRCVLLSSFFCPKRVRRWANSLSACAWAKQAKPTCEIILACASFAPTTPYRLTGRRGGPWCGRRNVFATVPFCAQNEREVRMLAKRARPPADGHTMQIWGNLWLLFINKHNLRFSLPSCVCVFVWMAGIVVDTCVFVVWKGIEDWDDDGCGFVEGDDCCY